MTRLMESKKVGKIWQGNRGLTDGEWRDSLQQAAEKRPSALFPLSLVVATY